MAGAAGKMTTRADRRDRKRQAKRENRHGAISRFAYIGGPIALMRRKLRAVLYRRAKQRLEAGRGRVYLR